MAVYSFHLLLLLLLLSQPFVVADAATVIIEGFVGKQLTVPRNSGEKEATYRGELRVVGNATHPCKIDKLRIVRIGISSHLKVSGCKIGLVEWKTDVQHTNSKFSIVNNHITGMLYIPSVTLRSKFFNISNNNFTSSRYVADLKTDRPNQQRAVVDIAFGLKKATEGFFFVGNEIYKPAQLPPGGSEVDREEFNSSSRFDGKFGWRQVTGFLFMEEDAKPETLKILVVSRNTVRLERFDGWSIVGPGFSFTNIDGKPITTPQVQTAAIFIMCKHFYQLRTVHLSHNNVFFTTGGGGPSGIVFMPAKYLGTQQNRDIELHLDNNTVVVRTENDTAEWAPKAIFNETSAQNDAYGVAVTVSYMEGWKTQREWAPLRLSMSGNKIDLSYLPEALLEGMGMCTSEFQSFVEDDERAAHHVLNVENVLGLSLNTGSAVNRDSVVALRGPVHFSDNRVRAIGWGRAHCIMVRGDDQLLLLPLVEGGRGARGVGIFIERNTLGQGAKEEAKGAFLHPPSIQGQVESAVIVFSHNYVHEVLPMCPSTPRHPARRIRPDGALMALYMDQNQHSLHAESARRMGWRNVSIIAEHNVVEFESATANTAFVGLETFYAHELNAPAAANGDVVYAVRAITIRRNRVRVGTAERRALPHGVYKSASGIMINCVRFRWGWLGQMEQLLIEDNDFGVFLDPVVGLGWSAYLSQVAVMSAVEVFIKGGFSYYYGSNSKTGRAQDAQETDSGMYFPLVSGGMQRITLRRNSVVLSNVGFPSPIALSSCFRVSPSDPLVNTGSIEVDSNTCEMTNLTQCPSLAGCGFFNIFNSNVTALGQVRLLWNRFHVTYEKEEEGQDQEQLETQPLSLFRMSSMVFFPPTETNFYINTGTMPPKVDLELSLNGIFALDLHTLVLRGNLFNVTLTRPRAVSLFDVSICGVQRLQHVIIAENTLETASRETSSSSVSIFSARPVLAWGPMKMADEQREVAAAKVPPGMSIDMDSTMLYMNCPAAAFSAERSLRILNNTISSSNSDNNRIPNFIRIDNLYAEGVLPPHVRDEPAVTQVAGQTWMPPPRATVVFGASAFSDASFAGKCGGAVPLMDCSFYWSIDEFSNSYSDLVKRRSPWMVELARRQQEAEWEVSYVGIDPASVSAADEPTGGETVASPSSAAAAAAANNHNINHNRGKNTSEVQRLLQEERLGGIYVVNNSVRGGSSPSSSSSSSSSSGICAFPPSAAIFGLSSLTNVTVDALFLFDNIFDLVSAASSSSSSSADPVPTLLQFVPTRKPSDAVKSLTQTTYVPRLLVLRNVTVRVRCLGGADNKGFACGRLSDAAVTVEKLAGEQSDSVHVVRSASGSSTRVDIVDCAFFFSRAAGASSNPFAACTLPWLQIGQDSAAAAADVLLAPPVLTIANVSITIETQPGQSLLGGDGVGTDMLIAVPVSATVNATGLRLNFPGAEEQKDLTATVPIVKLYPPVEVLQSAGAAAAAAAVTSEQLLKELQPRDFSFEATTIDAPALGSATSFRLAGASAADDASGPSLLSDWKLPRGRLSGFVHCLAFTGAAGTTMQLRRSHPIFAPLAGLAQRGSGRSFFEGCPLTETRTLSRSTSTVPFCADFSLDPVGPALDMGALMERQKQHQQRDRIVVRASFSIVPARFAPAPAGRRSVVPPGMAPLPGVVQSEAFTVFKDESQNISVPEFVRSADGPDTSTVVAAGSGAKKQVDISFTLGKTVTADKDHLLTFRLHRSLLACRWKENGKKAKSLSSASPSSGGSGDWFTAQLKIGRTPSEVSEEVKTATVAMQTFAAFAAAPLSGPLVGGALIRAGAVQQFADCSFSMDQGMPLPFIENPMGFGFGAAHGYWRRGALWGNLLILLIICFLLSLIAYVRVVASKRRHARWCRKHQAEVTKHEDVLVGQQTSRLSLKQLHHGQQQQHQQQQQRSRHRNEDDDDDDGDGRGDEHEQQQQEGFTRAASLRRLKELRQDKKKNEPKILRFIDALYLAKFPATLVIPITLLTTTASHAVSLIVGGFDWTDRILGVVFTVAFLLWFAWMLHVILVQLPQQPLLRYVLTKPDTRRFWGQPDPNAAAGDAELQTKVIFQDCPRCRPALKLIKKREKAAVRETDVDEAFGRLEQPRREMMLRRGFGYFARWAFWQMVHVYGGWAYMSKKKALKHLKESSFRTTTGRGSSPSASPASSGRFSSFMSSFRRYGSGTGSGNNNNDDYVQRHNNEKSFRTILKEKEERKRAKIMAAPDIDRFFLPRTADVFVQVAGHAKWYVVADFFFVFAVSVCAGIQAGLSGDCSTLELVVTIINLMPLVLTGVYWPYADRLCNVFSFLAAALIVVMTLFSALSTAFVLPGLLAFLGSFNMILGAFGALKAVSDLFLLAISFESWLLLPLFFLVHVLCHHDEKSGGLGARLQRWWNKKTDGRRRRLEEAEEELLRERGQRFLADSGVVDEDMALDRRRRALQREMAEMRPLQPENRRRRKDAGTSASCWDAEALELNSRRRLNERDDDDSDDNLLLAPRVTRASRPAERAGPDSSSNNRNKLISAAAAIATVAPVVPVSARSTPAAAHHSPSSLSKHPQQQQKQQQMSNAFLTLSVDRNAVPSRSFAPAAQSPKPQQQQQQQRVASTPRATAFSPWRSEDGSSSSGLDVRPLPKDKRKFDFL